MPGPLSTAEEMELVLRHLAAVVTARVVVDAAGQVEEVRVISDGRRSPGQICRNVRSALWAHCGVDVPVDKIRVTQLAEDAHLIAPAVRPRLVSVGYQWTGGQVRTEVVLEVGERVLPGRAAAAARGAKALHSVAEATVAALRQWLGTGVHLGVEEVLTVSAADHRVVVVVVDLVFDNGRREVLCGSSLIRENDKEAVARATLDAVNRRLVMPASAQVPRDIWRKKRDVAGSPPS